MKFSSYDTKAHEQDKFVVRLPNGMREKIARTAKRHHRSMNAEIVHLLQQYLDQTLETHPSPVIQTDKLSALFATLKPEEQRLLLELVTTWTR